MGARATDDEESALPAFSVVIPAFQAEDFIAAAVMSVLSQSPQPLEVIVCDDGSTDRTAEVLRQFEGRITVLRKENGGEASARNAGARAAKGEFVAFLDADDRYLPGRLDALGSFARECPDIDVITTDAFLEIADEYVGRCYDSDMTFAWCNQRSAILRRNFIFGHVAVRRTRLLELGGYDERITYTTDWELWIRHILSGGKVGLVDLPLSVYRLHADAASSRRLLMAEGRAQTLRSAMRCSQLRGEERILAEESLALELRRADRERLSEALMRGDPRRSRAAAGNITRSSGHTLRSRVRAAAIVVAPRATSRMWRRRRRGFATGAGDRRIPNGGA